MLRGKEGEQDSIRWLARKPFVLFKIYFLLEIFIYILLCVSVTYVLVCVINVLLCVSVYVSLYNIVCVCVWSCGSLRPTLEG